MCPVHQGIDMVELKLKRIIIIKKQQTHTPKTPNKKPQPPSLHKNWFCLILNLFRSTVTLCKEQHKIIISDIVHKWNNQYFLVTLFHLNPEMLTSWKSEQERASEQKREQPKEQVSEIRIEQLKLASDYGQRLLQIWTWASGFSQKI